MPSHVRQLVLERAVEEHNIAMMPNHLSPNDTVSLAGSLGIPVFNLGRRIDNETQATAAELSRVSAPRLNLLDSGAAIDTSDGVRRTVDTQWQAPGALTSSPCRLPTEP